LELEIIDFVLRFLQMKERYSFYASLSKVFGAIQKELENKGNRNSLFPACAYSTGNQTLSEEKPADVKNY